MSTSPSPSTRTLANLIVDYARARKTTQRGTLFAYGAELALIDSLMLAKVSEVTDGAEILLMIEQGIHAGIQAAWNSWGHKQ